MKKRLLSLGLVLAMLLTVVSMPASASVGKLSVMEYADVVETYNPGILNADVLTQNIITAEDGALKISNTGGTTQVRWSKVSPNTDADAETFGALSFKIKADESNANDAAIIFILGGVSDNPAQIHSFALTSSTMGMSNPAKYGAVRGEDVVNKTEYNKGQWYTVGIVYNKNQTMDYYVDGEFIGTSKFDDNKSWDKETTGECILFANAVNAGTFYMDEITWNEYSEDSFFAETVGKKTSFGAGETARIKFTEPIATPDADNVKLINCSTGEEISSFEAYFEDEYLNVTIPEGLNAGFEYRVEMNDFKGALGRTLETDNIYFNYALDGNEATAKVSEYFDDFAATATLPQSTDSDYYQPNGWYLGHRWPTQTVGFIRPATDSAYGTVMQVGSLGNDGGSSNAYMPLGADVTTGVVTISYDMKPERAGNLWNGSFAHTQTPNLVVMVYPDGIDSTDKVWASGDSVSIGKNTQTGTAPYGRPVAGIFARNISTANAPDWASMTTLKALTMDTTDENKVSSTDSKWYEMKIELDFDNGTTAYYIDGAKTVGASLEDLGIDGIQGISFGTRSNAVDASTLIDNVEIEYTYVENIKTVDVKGEDFDDFETTATLPSVDTDYYQPDGWYLGHKWNTQTAQFFRPATDAEMGEVLQVGNAGSDGGSSHGYMPLNKNISSGIVTISFDMKPERVSDMWNDGWVDARTPNLVVMAYPDGIDDTDKVWAQGDSVSIGKPASGRYLAGIFAHHIGASRLPGVGNNTDQRISLKELTVDGTDTKKVSAADSKWYKMKIELNFDEGTTTYWLDGVETAGESLATLNIDGIQGISFGTPSNARDASTLIDNVLVQYTYNDVSAASGVMQVRFSDYYGNNYGAATVHSTILDTIAVNFWAGTVETPISANFELIDEYGHIIPFEGEYDSESDVYFMNLREYLTIDTEYTLTVSGIIANGEMLPDYKQTIKADSEGVVIVEPMYIWKNAEAATSGTLAENDTITAGTRLINTTGETENYAFFMALYAGNTLYLADFDEIEQDGYSTADDKEANVSASFTMSSEDAAAITKVKAFLWKGTEMKPILPAIEFNKTAN